MIDRSEAEEHLRVIRSLMEKATVYRAISAPGALIAGGLSIAAATFGVLAASAFAPTWAVVLALTTAANLFLLRRDRPEGETGFLTQRMTLALRGMLPALLTGGLVTLIKMEGGRASIASLWVLLYGVSLLAAAHFAPKSICWLGRSFFLAGGALLLAGAFGFDHWRSSDQLLLAHAFMGGTFGLFHLIYGAFAWPRRTQ
jgi:hypothetical protein